MYSFGKLVQDIPIMAKRSSLDIRPQNANPRKSKNRIAAKKKMLAERAAKKEENKKKNWKRKK